MNRRSLVLGTSALVPLALVGVGLMACSSTSGGTTVTLAMIQSWATTVVGELPTIEQTLIADGTLKPADLPTFQKAVAAAQAELVNLMALTPSSGNATAVVQALGAALTTAAGFIPAAQPFAPLIGIAVMLAQAFIASMPTPIAVPPAPAPADAHVAAMKRTPRH